MGVVDFVRKVVSTPKPPQPERQADIIVLEEWRKARERRRRIRIEGEGPQEKSG